ncbi:uncharacterized protein N7511_009487 [Penicillium nucicola]|uniref:uncharacterized protein n=1 Tax=Penicillium nucicola TaxID=1850975 RepID=UPI0025455110|nr:uncharacterized protein N7511_009487 [Penicillium nucicola]KAJ5747791.1 hypothetical protein N7511_009487 [Penicillium nucicola]
MSAPRSSLRALRVLSQPTAPSARRCLHITGVQSAQPANTTDKAVSNHDMLQSKAFAISMRRINGNAFSDTPRQFNTSRSSKARNDTSTVDLVYMPTMADLDAAPMHRGIQVPVLPETHSIGAFSSTPSAPPMKPQIYTVAGTGADVAASAMSEVVDNHAVDLDPFSLTEAVGRSRVGEELSRQQNGSAQPGAMRELWTGFLDDVMGPKEVRK